VLSRDSPITPGRTDIAHREVHRGYVQQATFVLGEQAFQNIGQKVAIVGRDLKNDESQAAFGRSEDKKQVWTPGRPVLYIWRIDACRERTVSEWHLRIGG
jgi:hypothetical protein